MPHVVMHAGSGIPPASVVCAPSRRSNDLVGPAGGRCLRRAGKSNRDEETAGGTGCEVEGPVVCSDDAVHDGQPEADAGMLVGAYALARITR